MTTDESSEDRISRLVIAGRQAFNVLIDDRLYAACCDGKLRHLYVARQHAVDAMRGALCAEAEHDRKARPIQDRLRDAEDPNCLEAANTIDSLKGLLGRVLQEDDQPGPVDLPDWLVREIRRVVQT